MIAYLDTNVVVWLAQGDLSRIGPDAANVLEQAELLVSPMVLLELESLYEAKRINLPARDIQNKVEHELDIRVCDLPFSTIASAALGEKWTRDPFDRLIVANAKVRGFCSPHLRG